MLAGPGSRRVPARLLRATPAALLTLFVLLARRTGAAPVTQEDLVLNITRLEGGDVFFVNGGDCSVTRCVEVSGGTALSERPPGIAGPPCACRCRALTPLFREDKTTCVSDVTECSLAQFGSGDGSSRAPLVFLPLSGQILHPSKEIYFPEAENAVCGVSSAQFLTRNGWNNLREELDNDVPFSLFRDEGKTFLMWRGSEDTRSRLTGRVVLVRLACRVGPQILLPCAAFRVQGSPLDLPNEITEVWFSRGDPPTESSFTRAGTMGTSLLLCALVATLLYSGALLLYLRAKRRRLPPRDDIKEEDYHKDIDMPNTTTNPLLSLAAFLSENHGTSCESEIRTEKDGSSRSYSSQASSISDSLEKQSEDTAQSDPCDDTEEKEITATIHHLVKSCPSPGSCASPAPALVERRPELHVAIVDEDEDDSSNRGELTPAVPPLGNTRKKLYFNPAFLEPQMLKNPPPAAIDFLIKIREVIAIAKDKMLAKRFIPTLSMIIEERFCHEVELSLSSDLFKSKYVAYSLKRENSRRKTYCSGCPGCTNSKFHNAFLKTLSEKEFCKSCISNDHKENIVREWLDKVPVIESNNDKYAPYNFSISKIEGTPTSVEPIKKEDEKKIDNFQVKANAIEVKAKSKKEKSPPPPPIRTSSIMENSNQEPNQQGAVNRKATKKKEDELPIPIPPELKKKMNAVIDELSKFRRIDPILPRIASPVTEIATPFVPKLVIPVTPKVIINQFTKTSEQNKTKEREIQEKNKILRNRNNFEADSLERNSAKRRASLSNLDFTDINITEIQRNHKRRSSIIAMDELEPLKKIHEVSSRLSLSYQGIEKTNEIVNNVNNSNLSENNVKSQCKTYAIQRTNLVSEVYINDYINTMSSSDSEYSASNTSLKVKYAEPITKPGQLVIEVQNKTKVNTKREDEDFDPDTLDRKPTNSKGSDEASKSLSPKLKTVEHIFLKSPASFKTSSNDQATEKFSNKFLATNFVNTSSSTRRNSDLSDDRNITTFSKTLDNNYNHKLPNTNHTNIYENCLFGDQPNGFPSGPRSLSSIFLEKKEDIKPPLPPKKSIGGRKDCQWNQQNTYRVNLTNQNSFYTNNDKSSTYRITRSEPPKPNIEVTERPYFHRPIVQSKGRLPNIRNYTSFGSMRTNNVENEYDEPTYSSLDPNYENYNANQDSCKSIEEVDEYFGKIEHTKESENFRTFSIKRPIRSARNRPKKVQQSKHHKTEDSGYLSSDSNESRKKRKFVLQVRDKDIGKEMVSDTDDVESMGDARSESGGESIETNSVFFGSFRRMSSVNKKTQDKLYNGEDVRVNRGIIKSDFEKELKSVISIISPRERLAALDDL